MFPVVECTVCPTCAVVFKIFTTDPFVGFLFFYHLTYGLKFPLFLLEKDKEPEFSETFFKRLSSDSSVGITSGLQLMKRPDETKTTLSSSESALAELIIDVSAKSIWILNPFGVCSVILHVKSNLLAFFLSLVVLLTGII